MYQGDSFQVILRGANRAFGVQQWPVIGKAFTKATAAGLAKGKNAFKMTFFQAFTNMFKGMTTAELDTFFRRLVEIGNQDVHRGLLHKIREHERKGDHIIVLSGAFQPFLKAFTRAFALDIHMIGTDIKFDQNGVCTGRVGSVVNGAEKVHYVQTWIDQQIRLGHLSEQEAEETWAYADSESDVPLLSFVKYPLVVNPDKPVKKVARKRGWPLFG